MLRSDGGAIRFANTSNLDEYLGKCASPFPLLDTSAAPEFDWIGRSKAFEEALFLGLRLNDGVELERLRNEFGEQMIGVAMDALLEVRDAGLLELSSERMRLTPQGRLASNEVFSRLLIPSAA
jgi:oxygen-independent coproporphyrinogen-3 oxidase